MNWFEVVGKVLQTGEVAGSAAAAVMPTLSCQLVMFKAVSTNGGFVNIGLSGVTLVNGVTDTTSGWELDAGEETPWLPCKNLNDFYYICTGTGDEFIYVAVG